MFIVLSHYHFHEMIVTPVEYLALCVLSNFSCFCCRLLTFLKNQLFQKNYFRSTFSVSNGLDQDQDRHSVSLDLGPNCLQRLPADDFSSLARKELNRIADL